MAGVSRLQVHFGLDLLARKRMRKSGTFRLRGVMQDVGAQPVAHRSHRFQFVQQFPQGIWLDGACRQLAVSSYCNPTACVRRLDYELTGSDTGDIQPPQEQGLTGTGEHGLT